MNKTYELDSYPILTGRHWLALVIGLFLFLVFFGLTQTAATLSIIIKTPFTWSSSGEAYFWLAHALLLFPGGCLIGYGLSPWLAGWLRKAWQRTERMPRKERTLALVLMFAAVVLTARLSHTIILSDYPITDDEYAVKFGGQVLAQGKVMTPAPLPFEPFPKLYLFEKGGKITSFDWIGPQLAWAVAEITHSGPLIFAVLAATTALCLAVLMGSLLSPGYGSAAFVLFFFSPMAFALSATTHAHLLSRAMIAVTLLCYVMAGKKGTLKSWVLTGLALGSSLCCRPIETAFILAPLFLHLALTEISREKRFTVPIRGILLGILLPFLVFLLHNQLVTGHYYFPARFASAGLDPGVTASSLWNRFGSNASYNLFMLTIWFLGPLGILLTVFGTLTNRFTKLLAAGLALVLAAGCFHDNQGIHIVGPIHYSECIVPLIIIGTYGLANIKRWMNRKGISFGVPAAVLTGALVLGLGLFNFWQAQALHKQASIQKDIYGFIETTLKENRVKKAVVLAPQFWVVWESIPRFKEIGTWVREWKKARPDLSDRTLILYDVPKAEAALREKFPDRVFFRLATRVSPPYLKLDPICP